MIPCHFIFAHKPVRQRSAAYLAMHAAALAPRTKRRADLTKRQRTQTRVTKFKHTGELSL